jgi:hypothetical protein
VASLLAAFGEPREGGTDGRVGGTAVASLRVEQVLHGGLHVIKHTVEIEWVGRLVRPYTDERPARREDARHVPHRGAGVGQMRKRHARQCHIELSGRERRRLGPAFA